MICLNCRVNDYWPDKDLRCLCATCRHLIEASEIKAEAKQDEKIWLEYAKAALPEGFRLPNGTPAAAVHVIVETANVMLEAHKKRWPR